jgi:RNA polymerase sigma-70 factor (ECF subfamily)
MEADSDLLRSAAAGDRPAFERFIGQHAGAVLRFCLLRTRDRHSAEDAAQEALLRLYQQVCAQRIPDEPLPWLFAIARRCCQEAERRSGRGGVPLDESILRAPTPEEPPDLSAAMQALNDFESVVLHLKHTEGLRCTEISLRLGKPLGTITAALSRAYTKLRAALHQEAKP